MDVDARRRRFFLISSIVAAMFAIGFLVAAGPNLDRNLERRDVA